MSFFQAIVEFFQNLFNSSSPEVKKRQALRKIETDLHNFRPVVYKGDLVHENFAEALRILYVYSKPIESLLASTLFSDDMTRNARFQEQLLLTGFSAEASQTLDSLAYEKRKAGAVEAKSLNRYFEGEHHKLQNVIRELGTSSFLSINTVLNHLAQLNDLCHYSYITALRLFDVNFSTSLTYQPAFQAIPPDLLDSSLCDLYFIVSGMDITVPDGNAILALAKILHGGIMPDGMEKTLMESLKKMQSVIKRILDPEILKDLICVAKKDPEFKPTKATYDKRYTQSYADYLEMRFSVDESRLKTEIQDETITSELHELFGDTPLEVLQGYNNEFNTQLKQSTQVSFSYVLPLQILKTFMTMFYTEQVKALLNDIVIEGFFNNPSYKSDFSAAVYTCNDMLDRIAKFEQNFERGNEFDEANLSSLIRDSHKDTAFANRLKENVDKLNQKAKEILQMEVTNVHRLYNYIGEVLLDYKKPTPDAISNLKVLMVSSRNHDTSEQLEVQYSQWKIFLEIMKNYVIIGSVGK